MKSFISMAMAAAAIAAAAPAQAGDEPSKQVYYGDLNLAAATGARTLESRVRLAAKQVCGTFASSVLDEVQRVQKCRKTAFERARPQMQLALDGARQDRLAMLTVRR